MTDTTEAVHLNEQGIHAVARSVAERMGLDPAGARIIKFTNNAVVRLPAARAVVRIAGSAAVSRRVDVILAAARLYAQHGVPAVRLHLGAPGQVSARGHVATVWADGQDADAAKPDPADLARTLRTIHAIQQTPAQIPAWDPIDSIRRRIAAAHGVADNDLSFLSVECDDLEIALKSLGATRPLLPPGLIHGDAFLGNLIAARPHPLICDFDSTAIGPREWDLTPIAVGALRMNYPDGLQRQFADAYGLDITTWDGFPTFRRLRELQLVTSVLPALNANPALRPQWKHRLQTLRTADTQTRWEPYPHSE